MLIMFTLSKEILDCLDQYDVMDNDFIEDPLCEVQRLLCNEPLKLVNYIHSIENLEPEYIRQLEDKIISFSLDRLKIILLNRQ